MEQSLLLEKLDSMEKRLGSIESAVSAIAVQDNKIINIQNQINALWKKQDELTGPDGTISKIKGHQASCPRPQLARLWWAVGILSSVFAATFAVILSSVGHQ